VLPLKLRADVVTPPLRRQETARQPGHGSGDQSARVPSCRLGRRFQANIRFQKNRRGIFRCRPPTPRMGWMPSNCLARRSGGFAPSSILPQVLSASDTALVPQGAAKQDRSLDPHKLRGTDARVDQDSFFRRGAKRPPLVCRRNSIWRYLRERMHRIEKRSCHRPKNRARASPLLGLPREDFLPARPEQ